MRHPGAARAGPWHLAHEVGHARLAKEHKPVHHASTGNPMHAQETAEVPARDRDQRARIRKAPLLR